jgi:hypothetical protein
MRKSLYEVLFESESLNEMAQGRSASKTNSLLLSAGGRADAVDAMLTMFEEVPSLKSDEVIAILRRTGSIQPNEMESETLSKSYVTEILRNQPILLGAYALGMIPSSQLDSATYRTLVDYSGFSDSKPLSGTVNVLKNAEMFLEESDPIPLNKRFLKPQAVEGVSIRMQSLKTDTWSGDGLKTYSNVGNLPAIDIIAAVGSLYQSRAYEIVRSLYDTAVESLLGGKKRDILSNIAKKKYRVDIIKHLERIMGQQVDAEWEGHTADFSLLNMKGFQPGVDAMASLAIQFSDIYGEPNADIEALVMDFYSKNPKYFSKLINQSEKLIKSLNIAIPGRMMDSLRAGEATSVIPFLKMLGNATAKSDHLEHLTYKYRFQLMFEVGKEMVSKESLDFDALAALQERISWGNRPSNALYAPGITWALGQALSGEPIDTLAEQSKMILEKAGVFGTQPDVEPQIIEDVSDESDDVRKESKYRLSSIIFDDKQ